MAPGLSSPGSVQQILSASGPPQDRRPATSAPRDSRQLFGTAYLLSRLPTDRGARKRPTVVHTTGVSHQLTPGGVTKRQTTVYESQANVGGEGGRTKKTRYTPWGENKLGGGGTKLANYCVRGYRGGNLGRTQVGGGKTEGEVARSHGSADRIRRGPNNCSRISGCSLRPPPGRRVRPTFASMILFAPGEETGGP